MYQRYFDFEKAFNDASKGTLVMAESGLFLEYGIRTRFTDK